VNEKMTAADERRDRAVRLAAVTLAVFVLTLFAAASVMLLAGCGGDPCAGHGGTNHIGGGWSYCNDGTVQPG
jgi:hypothetical protein